MNLLGRNHQQWIEEHYPSEDRLLGQIHMELSLLGGYCSETVTRGELNRNWAEERGGECPQELFDEMERRELLVVDPNYHVAREKGYKFTAFGRAFVTLSLHRRPFLTIPRVCEILYAGLQVADWDGSTGRHKRYQGLSVVKLNQYLQQQGHPCCDRDEEDALREAHLSTVMSAAMFLLQHEPHRFKLA